jgi:hypothetical protein
MFKHNSKNQQWQQFKKYSLCPQMFDVWLFTPTLTICIIQNILNTKNQI